MVNFTGRHLTSSLTTARLSYIVASQNPRIHIREEITMSVQDTRKVVSRAVMDEEFRRTLFSDPDTALTGYDLTPDEVQALRSIPAETMDDFANHLEERISMSVIAFGAAAFGSQAEGSTAHGAHAAGSSAMGSQAEGAAAYGAHAAGSSAMGSQAEGSAAYGAHAAGSSAMGSQAEGAAAYGAHAAGSSAMGSQAEGSA